MPSITFRNTDTNFYVLCTLQSIVNFVVLDFFKQIKLVFLLFQVFLLSNFISYFRAVVSFSQLKILCFQIFPPN